MPVRREANEAGDVAFMAATSSPRRLTPREVEVLESYERHGVLKLVAHELGISYQTVKNYTSSIQHKMRAASLGQAAVRFERLGGVERRSGKDRRG